MFWICWWSISLSIHCSSRLPIAAGTVSLIPGQSRWHSQGSSILTVYGQPERWSNSVMSREYSQLSSGHSSWSSNSPFMRRRERALSALHCQEKHFTHQRTVSHFALHVPYWHVLPKNALSTWLFDCSLDTGIRAWLGDAFVMCCSSFSLSPFCSWSLTTVSTISLLWLTMTNSPRLN